MNLHSISFFLTYKQNHIYYYVRTIQFLVAGVPKRTVVYFSFFFFCLYVGFLQPIYLINFSQFAIFFSSSKYFNFSHLSSLYSFFFFLLLRRYTIYCIFKEKEKDSFSCAADLITLKRLKYELALKLVPSPIQFFPPINKWKKVV